MSISRTWGTVAGLFAGSLLSMSAHAQILQVNANGTSALGQQNQNYYGGYADLATAHNVSLLAYESGGFWSAAGEYDFSALHAQVVEGHTPPAYFCNSNAGIFVNDLVSVTSSVLPYGTPVVLHLFLAVHATFSSSDPSWSPSGYDDVVATLNNASLDMRNTGTQTIPVDVSANIGGVFALSYSMLISGIAPSNGTFDLNAWDTAALYIQPSSPSVRAVSACGLAYPAQPVPEPATFVVLAVPAPALLRRRKCA